MSGRRPPRLAAWLLTRCLPGDHPLVGDLLEDFATRPGHVWFWRQTLVALFEQSSFAQAPWTARAGGVLVLLTLAGGLALASRPVDAPLDLPDSIERFTVNELFESRDGMYGPWRLPGQTVEVTGTLDEVHYPRDQRLAGRMTVALVVTTPSGPRSGRIYFSVLTPAERDDLTAGHEVTLRCQYGLRSAPHCSVVRAHPEGDAP